jgi:hypothetical protein
MDWKTFNSREIAVAPIITEELRMELAANGAAERALAIVNGDVRNEIPFIVVKVDAVYSKRSHGKFDAPSCAVSK